MGGFKELQSQCLGRCEGSPPYGQHYILTIPCVCTTLQSLQFAFIHMPSRDVHHPVASSGRASHNHIAEEELFSVQARKKGKREPQLSETQSSNLPSMLSHTFSLIATILGWFLTWGS